MSDENDMLHVAAIGRFEPGDVDPDGFHVLLSGSKRAVGQAGQFLGEAVVISTADLHAAALARADALEAALKRTEANRDAAMEDAAEEYARAERAEALLAEAVDALRPFAIEHSWDGKTRFEIVLASQTGSIKGADLDRARAILAAIPPAAPWTPPEDRPDGFECFGFIEANRLQTMGYGGWEKVVWCVSSLVDSHWYIRHSGEDVRPTAFAPLPPAPESQP